MTTEAKEQIPIATSAPNPAHPDWYLQSLVGMINGNEIEKPITLFVSGLVVSGYIVSGHRYFEGIGEQIAQSLGGQTEDTAKAIKCFTSPGDIYRKPKGPSQEQLSPPQYIHLRCAQIFVPGQPPLPIGGAWWRGRLSSVDGFLFGSLAVGK